MKKKELRNSKEIKLKAIIIATLFVCLLISFAFSEKIESALKLKVVKGQNEVSSEKIVDSDFNVCCIDVGQGNSSYVELPDGKTILIDGGDSCEGENLCEFLESKNCDSIDYMIATHADADHIGGLNLVLDRYQVKNIFRPFQICGTNMVEGSTSAENFEIYKDEDLKKIYEKIMSDTSGNSKISRVDSITYRSFITKIYNETYDDGNKICDVYVFYDGLTITGENYEFSFYSPLLRLDKSDNKYDISNYSGKNGEHGEHIKTQGYATIGYGASESNNCSAIMLLSIYDYDFLFTGDASFSSNETKGEEIDFVKYIESDADLVNKFSNIDMYLVGHHGSKTSSSERLLRIIKPYYAVISVAKDNKYGHPTNEAIERIEKYLRYDSILMTKDCGTIQFFECDGMLKYCLDVSMKSEQKIISWNILGTVLFLVCSYAIIMLRVRKGRK